MAKACGYFHKHNAQDSHNMYVSNKSNNHIKVKCLFSQNRHDTLKQISDRKASFFQLDYIAVK
jgi:hypothetical protein